LEWLFLFYHDSFSLTSRALPVVTILLRHKTFARGTAFADIFLDLFSET